MARDLTSSSVVNNIIGFEMDQLLRLGPNEHVPHEQGMVGTSADNADSDSITFVPTSKAVNDVNSISSVQVVDSTFAVNPPNLKVDV